MTVLVLPGGKPTSSAPTRPWQLANVRMALLAADLRREFGATIRLQRLRYRLRGWNSPRLDALADARSALAGLTESVAPRQIIVVGHSMGARVAAHLAGEQPVGGVVALAPWWPADDAALITPATRLLAVHGTADTWTDPGTSRNQVAAAAARGVDARWVGLDGADHYLLRRWSSWTELTVGLIRSVVDGRPGV
ncbi:MAG: alpha/beta hydrolase [Mycobacterium sp.]